MLRGRPRLPGNGVEQRQELGDVVPVPAGQRDGERGSVAVGEQVVLGTGAGAVDGRGADVIPFEGPDR